MHLAWDNEEILLSLIGGFIIGGSAAFYYAFCGKILGFSGIFLRGALNRSLEDAIFLAGAGVFGAIGSVLFPARPTAGTGSVAVDQRGFVFLYAMVIGWGVSQGNGCTSGHGVCGLGRLSPRSLASVLTFMVGGAMSAMFFDAFPGAKAYFTLPSFALLEAIPMPLVFLAALGLAWSLRKAASSASPPRSAAFLAASCVAGAAFGFGLAISGMVDAQAVLTFLNPLAASGWNPRLIFVMGGASAVTLVAFSYLKDRTPLLVRAEGFKPMAYAACPANLKIDSSLLVGSLVFGLGWGAGGYCPGPTLVSAVTGSAVSQTALTGVLVGGLMHFLYDGN